jgi:hypothetical protein
LEARPISPEKDVGGRVKPGSGEHIKDPSPGDSHFA